MAKKEPKEPKESKKLLIQKEKKSGIFNLISYLTEDKKLWSQLTFEEQKMFSPYMVNRFLSMDLFLVNAINDLQKYTLGGMSKEVIWRLYYDLLPNQRFYLKYVKGSQEIPEADLEVLSQYFGISKRECEDYWLILNKQETVKQRILKMKKLMQ